MKTLRSIEELNWALRIYSDIIKRGLNSPEMASSGECMSILEEFEEYEKCSDLYEVLKYKPSEDKIENDGSEKS